MANPDNVVANTKAAPSGRVVDLAGTPLPGAGVLLYHWVSPWGLNNRVVEKVFTDERGHFAFSEPLVYKTPQGTDRHDHYVMIASRAGFAPAWTLILGGTPEQNDFTLQLTAPVSQNFEVVDLTGHPVEGAIVWLRHASAQSNRAPFFIHNLMLPEDPGIWHAVTDGSGKATIDCLPDTHLILTASKQGFEDEIGGDTADGIIRFTLKPGATLEGRVIDSLGSGVEGATVWLYPRFRWNYYFMARTDQDGRYRVDKIWSNGRKEDWGRYQVGIRDSRFTAATRDVAFTSGQTIAGFDFTAIPGTEIVGQLLEPVTEQPVAGGLVYIDSPSGRQTRLTDASGQFKCRVAEGEVSIFFGSPPGGAYVVEDRSSRRESFLRTHAFGAGLPVTLHTPSALGKLGILRGKVVDRTGEPVAFCQVSAAVTNPAHARISTSGWTGNVFRGVHTKEDGAFTLTLPVGLTFVLNAENAGGTESGMISTTFSSEPLDLPEAIVLQPTQEADLILTDLSGAPRPNFAVDVTPQAKGVDLSLNRKEYTTDAQGCLHLNNFNSGLTYRIGQKGSSHAWSIFDPAKQASTNPATLLITDCYILRLVDSNGRNLPIKSLKEFFVWILSRGERVRWTNTLPDSLEKIGEDVTLPRGTVVLGRPGDKIDLLLETTAGDLVRASGAIPQDGAGMLVAQATNMAHPDHAPDSSIGPVQPDEIAGRVVDPEGKPVAGATVTFNGVFWPDFPRAKVLPKGQLPRPLFTTDGDGLFRVARTRDKWIVYITVFKEGFAPIYLTDIPKGKGFSIKLQNTTRLAGTIGGDRPGKVNLLLEKDKDVARPEMGNRIRDIQYRTETDENGAYDFPIEAGTYRFQAASADGRFAVGEVTALAAQTVAIPATLLPGVPVRFRLTDCQTGQPVPGIEICIMERQGDQGYRNKEGSSRTTDEKGDVEWDNLIQGEALFSSRRMSFPTSEEGQPPYVRWWRAGFGYRSRPGKAPELNEPDYSRNPPTGRAAVGFLFIDVRKGMEPLSILVEKGVKLSGLVVGPDGAPQRNAFISVVPHDGFSEGLTGGSDFIFKTDVEGRFSWYAPAGNGVAYVLCAYYRPESPSPLANAISEPFHSQPGDELTFRLEMPKGGWITGQLLGPEGRPTERLRVTATHADRSDLAYAKRIATPDEDGRFRLGPLRPGHYTVQYGQGPGVPLRVGQVTPANSREADVTEGQETDVGMLTGSP